MNSSAELETPFSQLSVNLNINRSALKSVKLVFKM